MFGILNETSINEELVDRFLNTKLKLELFLNNSHNSKLRNFDIAKKMGISEAELLSVKLDSNLKYLDIPDQIQFFNDIKRLKKVMFLTRNDDIVHEKTIIPNKLDIISNENNILLTCESPLLKFNDNLWEYAFSEYKITKNRELRSFQFFDKSGDSVLKIYLKSDDVEKFNDISIKYESSYSYQLQGTCLPSYNTNKSLKELVLLKKSININNTWNKKMFYSKALFRKMLQYLSKNKNEVSLYIIGNKSVQYHVGIINKVVDFSSWLNVLDPNFNIHVKEKNISSNITYYYNNESCHLHFFNNYNNFLCGFSFDNNILDIENVINQLIK
tara:strand:+ start:474 stop:1460 length:987 start_codon:yes stop_codon:yes gene_type:complete